MIEEWKIKGTLLQELDALRHRITQLEQSEHGKKNEELKISDTILDQIVEGVLLIDIEKKQPLTGNKAMCKILGCQREEIAHLRMKDVYPQEGSAMILRQVKRLPSGRPSPIWNIPVKRKDGSIFFADITSVPLTLAGKEYLLSVFRETHPGKALSIRQRNTPDARFENPHLTTTEINVLKLVVNGMSNKEIARLLLRSTRTIENHRAHLMKKLGVDNSVELVRRAVALGLVDLPAELQ